MFTQIITSFASPDLPLLDGKIVGGSIADILDYPYQVSVQEFYLHICGGSIISTRHIVTAAHCTYETVASYLNIRAGTSIRNSGGVILDVSIIYQHPDFNNETYDYDIAVLELVSDLTFNDAIMAISLPNENQQLIVGTESVITGWGATSEQGLGSNQLLMVEVPLVSSADCQIAYAPNYTITDRMLCAGYAEGGKDSCQGDSGGPLAVDGILIGIVSWGSGCAQPAYPGVYTNVPNLRSYIAEVSGI
ncbi:polyserase-related [Holotrichia oblita]|uniref:Polyserase-related n=2 Tax=Holotrichia oblita TaxID=644536 RepID=A0ACB9SYL7_HOLOL|nr:polyserase-related [Holotrichia oblita]KAI4459640.1 polyserase-related [Holotrichia oblita]